MQDYKTYKRCPPSGYGEQRNDIIYFRKTREQKSKSEKNRGTNVVSGSRELRKLRFWFWGTRENADIFQGNKGTVIPWEDLIKVQTIKKSKQNVM